MMKKANVIGSPKPKCLRYIVLSGRHTAVHQYLLLMPLHVNDNDHNNDAGDDTDGNKDFLGSG